MSPQICSIFEINGLGQPPGTIRRVVADQRYPTSRCEDPAAFEELTSSQEADVLACVTKVELGAPDMVKVQTNAHASLETPSYLPKPTKVLTND